jgi:UDP:flavonoid glycosyltransferase YjiC (YdhE family)
MKIVIPAIGSRGDVQPYLNLCQGLQAKGHDVILALNPTLYPLAGQHGLKAVPVGPPVDMGAEGTRLMASSFGNMWIGLIRVMRLASRLIEDAYADTKEACKGADLVIATDSGGGIAEAESLGLPWISVTLQPGRIPIDQAVPSLLARAFGALFGKLLVLPVNRSRKRLGAPPVEDIAHMQSKRLILLPVSPEIAPPIPAWPRQVRQTNYWYARSDPSWAPPADLVDFLERGDRPIAVSLGVMSMSGDQARQGARLVLDALNTIGKRAIIQGWDEALRGFDLPETVYHAGSLPHSWLFEQVDAVVHHGGFGTTAAALRAGVPGVIIPHIIDQFYWGQQVFQAGVGPQFIPRGKLTAQNLSAALAAALTDNSMRARAAELGNRIRSAPDGVTQAVEIIESILL